MSWGQGPGLSTPCLPALLRCYSCPSLRRGESCNQTQSCSPSQAFCKALVSDGQTGERTRGGWRGAPTPSREAHSPVGAPSSETPPASTAPPTQSQAP